MQDLSLFFEFLKDRKKDFTQEEFNEYIQPRIVLRRFRAREVVHAAGSIEHYFNFLLSGMARTYYKKGKEEIVIQIATEGHIIHAQDSFHSGEPSNYTVETIEPSCFVTITHKSLDAIYESSSEMQRLGRLVIAYALLLKEKMHVQAATLSPRERFFHFVEKHPELLQRVPQKYLASYLNIKPETFSRFKRLVKEQGI